MPQRLFDCRLPIIAAPMAGGPTTAALALAVTKAGGFAFLAGGYKSPEALATEIDQVRLGGRPFGVNLFVPSTNPVDLQEFRRYATSLEDEAARYGVRINPCPVEDDDYWTQAIALLLRDPVPVVSLTFGLPDAGDIAALR